MVTFVSGRMRMDVFRAVQARAGFKCILLDTSPERLRYSPLLNQPLTVNRRARLVSSDFAGLEQMQ